MDVHPLGGEIIDNTNDLGALAILPGWIALGPIAGVGVITAVNRYYQNHYIREYLGVIHADQRNIASAPGRAHRHTRAGLWWVRESLRRIYHWRKW